MATQGTEQFIVELILDTTNVQSSLNELVKSGEIDKKTAEAFKNTTDAMRKEAAEAKKTAAALTPLKKNIDDVSKATKQLTASFTAGVQDGIADALTEAGVSAEEFETALVDATKKSKTLKQELREVTQTIATLKVNDEVVPQELIERAGALKDAMADAAIEIANAGSDTRGLDNLLGVAQSVTAGFAVGQGVIGLFGDESEELQKTLLKVNSAMAVLQGLQQIQNALQKEGAISLFISNTQRKIQNAQTILNTGAESANVVVKYASVVAQKALNAAMAANPIGLVAVAIASLVTALSYYTSRANDAERQTGELNKALENSTTGFEESAANIRALGEARNKELEAAGAKQSEIQRNNLITEQGIAADRVTALQGLQRQINEAQQSDDKDVRKKAIELQAELRKIENESSNDRLKIFELTIQRAEQLRQEDLENAVQNAERRAIVAVEGTSGQLEAQKAAIEARLALEIHAARDSDAEQAKLVAQANKEKLQLDADYRKRTLDNAAKGIENELILVREGTEEEYILRTRLLATQRDAELTNTKLSEAEKTKVRQKAQKDQLLLDRNFAELTRKRAIENEISKNAAIIGQLNANEQDKLELSIQNISYAAQLEVDAALGNNDKIKEINAKRDADILATRRRFIEEAAAYEAEVAAVDNAPIKRALEKRLSEQAGITQKQRVSALAQLRDLEVAAVDKQIETQDALYANYLISDKEYELNRKKLIDARVKAETDGNAAILEDTKKFNQARTELILNTAQQTIGIFSQLSQIQADRDQADLDRRRAQLEELERVGAITEQEGNIRRKRIEAEERRAKRSAAAREKALAIFGAIISTAQGVAAALTAGPLGPALAAINAAIGAAQIAIIAARPIPQFATGKTKLNKYEGAAQVAETGTEIIERDGRMFAVTKPTIVDLRKDDIVHTPHQTRKIMQRGHTVDGQIVKYRQKAEGKMDMQAMAKMIADNVKNAGGKTEIHIDDKGISSITDRHTREVKYFLDRYKIFKK